MFLLFINYLFISFCHVRIYVNCLKYCINHSEARHSKGHEMSLVKQETKRRRLQNSFLLPWRQFSLVVFHLLKDLMFLLVLKIQVSLFSGTRRKKYILFKASSPKYSHTFSCWLADYAIGNPYVIQGQIATIILMLTGHQTRCLTS